MTVSNIFSRVVAKKKTPFYNKKSILVGQKFGFLRQNKHDKNIFRYKARAQKKEQVVSFWQMIGLPFEAKAHLCTSV
jgi:hypothetical protein